MPSFRDLVGQQRSISILQSFLKKKAYPQSLLFEGEAGIGKRQAAEIFTQSVLCQNDAENRIEACGSCLACQKFENQNHPDFSVIEPDGNTIKIEQIRKMQEKIVYQPIDGDKKIIIIDPADKMNGAAANGILKTLEEPPTYAILILISAKGAALLPTLRSRCQKISFHPLSFSQVITSVMQKKACSKSEAHFVVATANGQLGEALSMNIESAREVEERNHTLLGNDDLFETAARFSGSRPDLEAALFYLSTWFRDVLIFKSLSGTGEVDSGLLRYAWRFEEIKTWADKTSALDVCNILSDLQAVYLAQSRNLNRPLALETILLRIKKRSLPINIQSRGFL